MSLLGGLVFVLLGAIIGFWLEILMTPELPNGFYSCKDCGPSFVELYRQAKTK